jgi:hypothetical protein
MSASSAMGLAVRHYTEAMGSGHLLHGEAMKTAMPKARPQTINKAS